MSILNSTIDTFQPTLTLPTQTRTKQRDKGTSEQNKTRTKQRVKRRMNNQLSFFHRAFSDDRK